MFEKILVAVDGSEGARKALELAAGLGKRTNAELLVLHVREVEVGKFSGAMEPPQEARDLVNEVVAELADEGLVVKGQIRGAPFGRAAKEIVEEAEEAAATRSSWAQGGCRTGRRSSSAAWRTRSSATRTARS